LSNTEGEFLINFDQLGGRGSGRAESTPKPEDIGRAARTLVRRYAWRLVSEARLVEQVSQRLHEPEPRLPPTLDMLCEQAAGVVLFAACEHGGLRTATGSERRQMEGAYHDLGNYLSAMTPRLLPLAPTVTWDDLVQDTLIEIHQRYHTCEQPVTFLGWAVTILKRKGAATWRTRRREEPLPDDEAAEIALLPPRPGDSRNRHVDPEGDQEVLRILHQCLDTDEERLRMVWDIVGWKRREWALVFDAPLARFDQLGVTVKRKLRRCAAFLALVSGPVSA
jgi:DNA-directed RNA polymerase specialized sigma24 family protein